MAGCMPDGEDRNKIVARGRRLIKGEGQPQLSLERHTDCMCMAEAMSDMLDSIGVRGIKPDRLVGQLLVLATRAFELGYAKAKSEN